MVNIMHLIRKQFIHFNGLLEKEIMVYIDIFAEMANEERIGFLRNLLTFKKDRKQFHLKKLNQLIRLLNDLKQERCHLVH